MVLGLIPPGASVLDVGCGDGALLAELGARGHRVLGLDQDPAALAGCLARGVPALDADVERDLARLPDGAFDVAVLSHTLETLANPDAVVVELLRVVGPRGRVVVGFANAGHWLRTLRRVVTGRTAGAFARCTAAEGVISLADLRRFCAEHGLRIEHVVAAAGSRLVRVAAGRRTTDVVAVLRRGSRAGSPPARSVAHVAGG